MNCCEIKLYQHGEDVHIVFDCGAFDEGKCEHQGGWSHYAGGTCSHASRGASVGCWCNSKAAQEGAIASLVEKLNERIGRMNGGGISKVPLIKIIESLVAGDRDTAVAYAEHIVGNCEDKYQRTKDIFDKYDAMSARNILHVLKGEPKEGGVAVLDGGAK